MGSVNYIFANTGQLVRVAVQTVSSVTGDRVDGYVPIINSIIFPDLTVAAGYPQAMTRLGTGLYAHGIQIPVGVDALGSYIVSAYWQEGTQMHWDTFVINVSRPFGISAVTPI